MVEQKTIRDGDIIFQTSLSSQSKAIQIATKSKYSHCGIIYEENGRYYVFEAIQPVTMTPLERWVLRGKNSHFVIKRLEDADKLLTPAVLRKMKEIGKGFDGKPYDYFFEWSDDKIYCSELIWKIYKGALGVELGKLQRLRDFDLTNKEVRSKLEERYGNRIPLDEIVISPKAIFDSKNLITIRAN